MYGYLEEQVTLPESKEELYSKINQEEVFALFIKEPIDVDYGRYTAPYREDNNPSCYFQYYEDELRFIDYAMGDGHSSNNCIGFIMKCTNLNYQEAIKFILKNVKVKKSLVPNQSKKDKPFIKRNDSPCFKGIF